MIDIPIELNGIEREKETMSAEIVFVNELLRNQSLYAGKSIRVLGKIKKIESRKKKLYIVNENSLSISNSKNDKDVNEDTIVVHTADIQPTFPFRKHMLYTFIGEFVHIDNSNTNNDDNTNNMMMTASTTTTTTTTTTSNSSSTVKTTTKTNDNNNNNKQQYILKPRIVIQSEGVDFILYKQAILARRKFLTTTFDDDKNNNQTNNKMM